MWKYPAMVILLIICSGGTAATTAANQPEESDADFLRNCISTLKRDSILSAKQLERLFKIAGESSKLQPAAVKILWENGNGPELARGELARQSMVQAKAALKVEGTRSFDDQKKTIETWEKQATGYQEMIAVAFGRWEHLREKINFQLSESSRILGTNPRESLVEKMGVRITNLETSINKQPKFEPERQPVEDFALGKNNNSNVLESRPDSGLPSDRIRFIRQEALAYSATKNKLVDNFRQATYDPPKKVLDTFFNNLSSYADNPDYNNAVGKIKEALK